MLTYEKECKEKGNRTAKRCAPAALLVQTTLRAIVNTRKRAFLRAFRFRHHAINERIARSDVVFCIARETMQKNTHHNDFAVWTKACNKKLTEGAG